MKIFQTVLWLNIPYQQYTIFCPSESQKSPPICTFTIYVSKVRRRVVKASQSDKEHQNFTDLCGLSLRQFSCAAQLIVCQANHYKNDDTNTRQKKK